MFSFAANSETPAARPVSFLIVPTKDETLPRLSRPPVKRHVRPTPLSKSSNILSSHIYSDDDVAYPLIDLIGNPGETQMTYDRPPKGFVAIQFELEMGYVAKVVRD